MNKLSVFYEHIFEDASQRGITIEEALQYAKSCGIDLLECDLSRLSARKETKQLFDSCDIGVSCIYHFFDMINDSKEQAAEKYDYLFETVAYFGAERVLCVPGFYDAHKDRQLQLDSVVERLNEMCCAAEKYGITVTLEDFDDIASPCCRCSDLLYLMQNVKGLRYTFDMGNFRYCLEDAAQCYEVLSPYIAHAHCKDRSYSASNGGDAKADLSGALMYPSPVCEGVIGISALVKRMISDGYSGIFAIEHFGAADQCGYMKKSAENLRSAMKG